MVGRLHPLLADQFAKQADFQKADDDWSAELLRVFGRGNYVDARYTAKGRGADGSTLRALHDARAAAMNAKPNWLPSSNSFRTAGAKTTTESIAIFGRIGTMLASPLIIFWSV